MSFCSLSLEEHYKFGQFIGKFLEEDKNTWAVIASGDLSHRLTSFAPAGFSPKAQKFDKLLVQLLEEKEVEKILKINPELIREAGECGLRSIVLLLGIISSFNWKIKILSYEAPFGVGYLVAEIKFFE